MAEKKATKPEEAKPDSGKAAAAPAKTGSKKGRLIKIIAIAIVVLGAGGGGASKGWEIQADKARANKATQTIFIAVLYWMESLR